MSEITNTTLKINFTLHELKSLIIDNIEEAHNNSNCNALSNCTQYNI